MKLLTANRLTDGLVVWYTPAGWVEDAAAATRLSDEEADAVLNAVKPFETVVVAPYLIPLNDKDAPVQREHVREFVRANGPTIGDTAFDTAQNHNRAPVFED